MSAAGPDVSARMASRRGPTCRRFTLLDGMILVAAAAIVIPALQEGIGSFRNPGHLNGVPITRYPSDPIWLACCFHFAGFALMLSSVVLLFLRARCPSPEIGRVMHQPGVVGCVVVLANVWMEHVLRFIVDIVDWQRGYSFPQPSVGGWIWSALTPSFPAQWIAFLVITAWMILRLGGLWGSKSDWVDRTGFILGWAWIVWGFSEPFL